MPAHVWQTALIHVSYDCHTSTRVIDCFHTCVLWLSYQHTCDRLLSYMCLMTVIPAHVWQTAFIHVSYDCHTSTRVIDCFHTCVLWLSYQHTCDRLLSYMCLMTVIPAHVWQTAFINVSYHCHTSTRVIDCFHTCVLWVSCQHTCDRLLSYMCLMTVIPAHVW